LPAFGKIIAFDISSGRAEIACPQANGAIPIGENDLDGQMQLSTKLPSFVHGVPPFPYIVATGRREHK
jgi:hypothetical protein